MDEDIRESLSNIRQDVKDGFKSVNSRIDSLVTKGEFDATVQRLDSQHESLNSKHESLVKDFNTHEGATDGHMAQARADDREIRKEFKSELEGFKATTRWAIGLSATGAAILVSLAQWLIN